MTDVATPGPAAGPAADPPASGAARPARAVREVHVLPHTHWDREWYEPYPTFRLRLLDLLDGLLPRLDDDPAFAHFQLDGQMAMVDDYLALRPGEVAHVDALARAGRLSMGPWYVLPDEFLVSGETLVRNLQLGLERATAHGGAMQVGYLPDMFGHVAQMPQILARFGFADAVVWRGVPAAVVTPAFRWEAPDGSSVRAEYLAAGYFNGSQLPADADEARAKVDLFRALQGSRVGDPILLMAGMDHEAPPEHLTDVIAALNAADADPTDDADRPRYHLRIGSLEEYLRGVDRDDLPVFRGELRSGARANLLMGVGSNRVDVKQAAARAERTLERVAEPLAALWLPRPDRWRPVLEEAWLDVIRNAAHDSICACSHDEVVDAVLHRYAEATRLAQGIADRAVGAARSRMARPGGVVFNATARTRTDVVELDVPGDDGPGDEAVFQVLQSSPSVEEVDRLDAADAPLRLAIATMADFPATRAVRVEDLADGTAGQPVLEVTLLTQEGAEDEDDTLSTGDALAAVGRRCTEDPELQVRLVLHRDAPSRRVLTLADGVPGYGWARWQPVTPTHPVGPSGSHGLTNGVVTVEVDPTDGTFSLNGVAGYGRLVDDGDAGDTYNWCPVEDDVVVDAPTAVEVSRPEAGPLRGRLVVRSTYRLPERCVIEGRDEMTTDWSTGERYQRVGERVAVIDQVITTTIELRADDGCVRVDTAWDQRARDHRLRVHLPLPHRADHSDAEDAYAVVERPLWAEGGPNEWGVPTFPSRRFVRAGGLTVTHEGLLEYELVDLDHEAAFGVEPPAGTTAGTLALTLVRSTGWLSRGPMPSRPEPAGPFDRLEGAQVLKPLHLRYALQPDDTALAIDPHALADHVWNPLLVAVADGGGDLPVRGSRLDLGLDPTGCDGLDVDAVLRDDEDHLVVRAHATGDEPATLGLGGLAGQEVDLQGREVGAEAGAVGRSVALAPHRIVTVRLDGPPHQ